MRTTWSGLQLRPVIWHEGHVLWRVLRYDVTATILPGMLFSVAAWHTTAGMSRPLGVVLLQAALYFLLYALVFCWSNQLAGIAEDRRNKPSRPLPAGLVTIRGAWVRWSVVMVLFPLLGWWWGVWPWAVLWQLTAIVHNFGHGSRYLVSKNLCMVVGVLAQLGPAWQLVTPLTADAWGWILVPALTMLVHVSLQDMRDVAGDQLHQRRTLPLVLGWDTSRWVLAGAFLLLPLITHMLTFATRPPSLLLYSCAGILAILCFVIAGRLLYYTEPARHQQTYMLLTYWYCGLLASAIPLL